MTDQRPDPFTLLRPPGPAADDLAGAGPSLLDRAIAALVERDRDSASTLALLSIAGSLETLVAGPLLESAGDRFLADMAVGELDRAAPAPAARLARYLLAELDALDDLTADMARAGAPLSAEPVEAWAGRVRINVRDALVDAEAG
jgi:hypothetical protein